MSLIYSALNKLEQDEGASAVPVPFAETLHFRAEKKTGIPRWVYLFIGGCVVVVVTGWWSMNSLRAKFAAAQGAVSISQIAPASQVVETPVIVVPVVVAAAIDLSVAAPVMTPVRALPSPPEFPAMALTPYAKAEPAKAAQIKLSAPMRPSSAVEMITEAAPPPPIDPQETEQLTRAVNLAVQAGRNDEAQNLLKQLATRLPSESITLLRLNAWHSMQSGNSARAMALYRQIVERIPDDESAGINLALLYWKAGQKDDALRLIGALAERHPESNTVQKYNRELGAAR